MTNEGRVIEGMKSYWLSRLDGKERTTKEAKIEKTGYLSTFQFKFATSPLHARLARRIT